MLKVAQDPENCVWGTGDLQTHTHTHVNFYLCMLLKSTSKNFTLKILNNFDSALIRDARESNFLLTHHSGLYSDFNAAVSPASVDECELLLHHSFLLSAVLTHHLHSSYRQKERENTRTRSRGGGVYMCVRTVLTFDTTEKWGKRTVTFWRLWVRECANSQMGKCCLLVVEEKDSSSVRSTYCILYNKKNYISV